MEMVGFGQYFCSNNTSRLMILTCVCVVSSHLLLCLSVCVPIVFSLCSYGDGLQCCATSSQSLGEIAPCAGCGLLRRGVCDPAVFRCPGGCGVSAHREGRSPRQGRQGRGRSSCRAPKKSGIMQSAVPLQVGLAQGRVKSHRPGHSPGEPLDLAAHGLATNDVA